MLIQIDKLKRRPRQITVDEQVADFPVLRDLVAEGSVAFKGTIHGILQAMRSDAIIEVTGSLSTTISTPCGRCLTPVTSQLEIPVRLCYVSEDDDKEVPPGEEVELQSDELGLIPFSSPEIDLRPDLAQEIIMALPLQPLCTESCQGLCQICGTNLNQGRCDCQAPIFHAGLAALKNIKLDK